MKLYLYITKPVAFLSGDNSFHAMDHETHVPAWILAGTIDVAIDVDRKTVTETAIKTLDESEKELRAEFQSRLDTIKESRQKILSIPHLKSA